MTTKETLLEWAEGNLQNTGVPVVWANQNAPRPALPFVTLQILSRVDKEWSDIGNVDDSGNCEIINDRAITVSIQGFGPDCTDEVQALHDSLERITVQETLRAGGVCFIRTVSGVTDLTDTIGSKFEERAGFDIEVRVSSVVVDNPNYIDRVTGEGTLGSSEIETVVVTFDTGDQS